MRIWLLALTLAASTLLHAQQAKPLGPYDAHYIVIPTAMLKPEVAAQYGIVRSPFHALVNISVVERDGLPVPATVTGSYRNLLEQRFPLTFREVREGAAIYYLAELRYTDRDVLRFSFDIEVADPSGATHNTTIDHQQRMHREDAR